MVNTKYRGCLHELTPYMKKRRYTWQMGVSIEKIDVFTTSTDKSVVVSGRSQ
jgi:hypothetical protein